MTWRPQIVGRAAALAAAGCLLAGCLSVPHSGRVAVPGTNATGSVRNGQLEARIDALPPTPGESPTQIVTDFYNAMVDYNDDYAIAKQYLVKGSVELWKPKQTRAVVVLDVPDPLLGPAPAVGESYSMYFQTVGEVLADGEFVAVSGQKSTLTVTDTLRVVRDPASGNNWRIASGAPDALRLTIADFTTVYHEATLYFPAVGKDLALVSDRRWFAASRAELPRDVARAYVDGPSAFLTGGGLVAPLLPLGSAAVDANPIALGDAAMAFELPGVATDGLKSSLLKALQMTFDPESSDFSRLALTVNREPAFYSVAARPADTTPSATVASAWFIDGKQLLRPYGDAGAPPAEGDLPPQFSVKDMEKTTVSLSPDAMFAAGDIGRSDGTRALRIVARDVASQDIPLYASSLSSFSWSANGRGLWVAGAVSGVPTLWFFTITLVGEGRSATYHVSPATRVDLDSELTRDGRTLLDVRPSPDGVRMSAIVRERDRKANVLYVGRINMTQGTPAVEKFRRVAPVLSPPVPVKGHPLAPASYSVAQALWGDAESLVVVASANGGEYQLSTATVDGSQFFPKNAPGAPTFPTKGGITVAANAYVLALSVVEKKRLLSELTDAGWVPISKRSDNAAVVAIMYPG